MSASNRVHLLFTLRMALFFTLPALKLDPTNANLKHQIKASRQDLAAARDRAFGAQETPSTMTARMHTQTYKVGGGRKRGKRIYNRSAHSCSGSGIT